MKVQTRSTHRICELLLNTFKSLKSKSLLMIFKNIPQFPFLPPPNLMTLI